MADTEKEDKPPAPAAGDLASKGKGLKKTETQLKSGKPTAEDKAKIDWEKDFETTCKKKAYAEVQWNEKWVETLKALATENEQKEFFAEGILTGQAFKLE